MATEIIGDTEPHTLEDTTLSLSAIAQVFWIAMSRPDVSKEVSIETMWR